MPEFICVQCFTCNTFQASLLNVHWLLFLPGMSRSQACRFSKSRRQPNSRAACARLPNLSERQVHIECGAGSSLRTTSSTCLDCMQQVYAVSARAKDIRSVVMDLNTERGQSDQCLSARPQAPLQAIVTKQADQGQWFSFLSEVPLFHACGMCCIMHSAL